MKVIPGQVISVFVALLYLGAFTPSVSAAEMAAPKVGLAYKFQMVNSDDGLNKDADADVPTTTLRTAALRINFSGEGSPGFSYDVEIDGANTGMTNTGIIDHAELHFKRNNATVTVGNPKGLVFGWRQKLDGPMDYTASASAGQTPWGRAEALQVAYGLGANGKVTVQAARDVVNCSTTGGVTSCAGYTTTENSNTLALEWQGDFNGIMPLVQYATYDTNHSSTYSLGVRYLKGMADVRLDYITDNRWKRIDADNDGQDVRTGINLEGYLTFGVTEGFFHYSTYNNKDYVVSGATEPEVNSAGTFDDNKTTLALGATWSGLGKSFKPFFVWVSESGQFTDKNGKDADFTENSIKLGVKGTM